MYLKAPLTYIVHYFYGMAYMFHTNEFLTDKIYDYLSKSIKIDNIYMDDIRDICGMLSSMHMQEIRNIYHHFACGGHMFVFSKQNQSRKQFSYRHFRNYDKICNLSYKTNKQSDNKEQVISLLIDDISNFIHHQKTLDISQSEMFYLMFLSMYVRSHKGIAVLKNDDI